MSQCKVCYLATLLQIHAFQILAVAAQGLETDVSKVAAAGYLEGIQKVIVLREGH